MVPLTVDSFDQRTVTEGAARRRLWAGCCAQGGMRPCVFLGNAPPNPWPGQRVPWGHMHAPFIGNDSPQAPTQQQRGSRAPLLVCPLCQPQGQPQGMAFRHLPPGTPGPRPRLEGPLLPGPASSHSHLSSPGAQGPGPGCPGRGLAPSPVGSPQDTSPEGSVLPRTHPHICLCPYSSRGGGEGGPTLLTLIHAHTRTHILTHRETEGTNRSHMEAPGLEL